MKHIRRLNENILDDMGIEYNMVDGEAIVDGSVYLSNKDLTEILIKFQHINGSIDVSNNKLNTFEFLPYEAKEYIINNNPGVTGKLAEIVDMCTDVSKNTTPREYRVKGLYNELFSNFIKGCLDSDVWYDGETNFEVMDRVWTDVKYDYYKINKKVLMYGIFDVLDDNDVEILVDHFNIGSNDLSDSTSFFNSIIDHLKSPDEDVRISTYNILNSMSRNGTILQHMFDSKGLGKAFKELRNINSSNLSDHEVKSRVTKLLGLISNIMNLSDDQSNRLRTSYSFVFNGKYEFVEQDNGSYKKELSIEMFCKIDTTDPGDLQSVSMMKFRARSQGDLETYLIWIEKDIIDEILGEGDAFPGSDLPDYLISAIDSNKTKI
jgi:hypothetical protein